MELDLRLKIRTGRGKSHAMTDWIDESNEQHLAEQKRREHHTEVFGPMCYRMWEALVARIKSDADKLNKTSLSRIKDVMRINERDVQPGGSTLYVDNQGGWPSIYLDVSLDIGGQSIHIHELRRHSFEGKGKQTDERLPLSLDANDQLVIQDTDGHQLNLEQVSQRILRRFIDR